MQDCLSIQSLAVCKAPGHAPGPPGRICCKLDIRKKTATWTRLLKRTPLFVAAGPAASLELDRGFSASARLFSQLFRLTVTSAPLDIMLPVIVDNGRLCWLHVLLSLSLERKHLTVDSPPGRRTTMEKTAHDALEAGEDDTTIKHTLSCWTSSAVNTAWR